MNKYYFYFYDRLSCSVCFCVFLCEAAEVDTYIRSFSWSIDLDRFTFLRMSDVLDPTASLFPFQEQKEASAS